MVGQHCSKSDICVCFHSIEHMILNPYNIYYLLLFSEAVRGGHIDVAEYLIEKGLDINLRTHGGTGGSPLWWAKHIHGKDHEIVKFLEKHGARDIEPDNGKPKKVEEYGVDEP